MAAEGSSRASILNQRGWTHHLKDSRRTPFPAAQLRRDCSCFEPTRVVFSTVGRALEISEEMRRRETIDATID